MMKFGNSYNNGKGLLGFLGKARNLIGVASTTVAAAFLSSIPASSGSKIAAMDDLGLQNLRTKLCIVEVAQPPTPPPYTPPGRS